MAARGQGGARGVALSVLAVLGAAVLVLAAIALVRHEQGKPVVAAAPPSSGAMRVTRVVPKPSSSARPETSPAATSRAARHQPTPPASTSAAPSPSRPPSAAPSISRAPASGHPTVVLDPGHNGGNAAHPAQIDAPVPAGYGVDKACNTTGTDTDSGYPEHAFTWDVAKRVRAALESHGVHVIMTRHGDSGVGPCVDRRAAIESEAGVDAAVAIHADGGPPSGHGFHICVDSRRPVGASAATVRRTSALDADLLTSLGSSSGLTRSTYIGGGSGYYRRDDLAGLNLSTKPTAFLELGNMRNAGDAALQETASGRARIAGAVTAGILAYLHAR